MTMRMTTALNEILPAVSGRGMEMESNVIRMMKDDVESLGATLAHLEGTESRRQGTIMEAAALRGVMVSTVDPAEMSDEELQIALMAAESFVRRGYEYLLAKQGCLEGCSHG